MKNWAGNLTFGAARVHHPTSLDELRHTVAASPRIRALGSGHSFSTVADTTGDLVRLDAQPAGVTVDPATATATVGAGLRYSDVATALHEAGWALANLASLPHISVAGSCATGTHGSGDSVRCLAAQVAALRMVGPDGDVTELRRGDRDFDGAVVALGALGIVTELVLDVEPAFEVAQSVRVDVSLDEVAGRFGEVFGAAYSVSVFTRWADGQADVWLKQRLGGAGHGGSGVGGFRDGSESGRSGAGWLGGRAAGGPVHPVPGMSPDATTTQLGVPGPWHRRLPHFRPEFTPSAGAELQSEFYLPRESAAAAIAAVRGIGHLVAPVLHISEIRTIRGDDLWLSPAYGRDTVALHFTWIDDEAAVRPALAGLEACLAEFDPRPHWGKLTTTVPAGHPRLADFAALAARLDPTGKFRNAYVDRLFATL